MNTDSPIIEIKNLTRRYGKLDAVNGLSLTVRAGKCYGFFGRNGAGKTTTIKCLLNLLRPNSGTARVFGLDPQTQRSGREIAAHLRAGHGRVLSVDDCARHAGISRLVPQTLERRHRKRFAETLSTRPEPEGQPISRKARRRNSRSSARFVRNRNCWCWTNRPPASTRLSAANSSRPSLAPTNPAIQEAGRFSSPRI
jgi:energy-coupling factor transporter ATP-binding protein EcfA2